MASSLPNSALGPAVVLAIGLLAATTPASASFTRETDYFVRDWSVEDGLAENTVSAVLQTRDGYLWLGSYGGLVRFDGVRFTVFDNGTVPEMLDNAVTSLFEAEDGTLWIGHETGKLTRLKAGRFESVTIPATVELGKITAIASDEAGAIWTMNSSGILLRVADGFVVKPVANVANNMVALSRSPTGTIWLAQEKGVFELSHGQLKSLEGAIRTTNGLVQGLCASQDGGLWVASEERLRKWKQGRWVCDLGASPWGAASVHKMIETKSGDLVAATAEFGLFLVAPSEPVRSVHFCRTNGLPSDWIVDLWEDQEGGLWAGTGGAGLLLLREKRVQTLSPPDQWQGRAVLSVSLGGDGSLWIGTEGAGLYHYQKEAWENFGTQQNLHPYVWSAVEDPGGTLWIGTWGAGLYARRNGQIEAVPLIDGPAPAISAVLCSRQGGLWVGTETGLVRYNEGRAIWYRQSTDGQALRRIRTVVEDRTGGVWFGSLGNGLAHFEDGKIRQFRKQDGLASDFIECLYLDAEGVLWIGTQGAGLCRLKEGRFASVTTRQGLCSAHISDIEQDDQGCFWMSSRDGVMRVRKADLDRCLDGLTNDVPCVAFGPWDGMPTATCSGKLQPAGCRTPDGRLWFPTPKGLVIMAPQTFKSRLSPLPVVIEKLSVDDHVTAEGISMGRQVQIPPGRHRLAFEYTGLSFVAPERMRFKYRVEGLDNEWVDAGGKRIANYNHIPPGAYSFRVTACGSDGVWNPSGAVVGFYVAPYFWETWWFRVLAVAGVVAASGGIVWFDSRRRLRRKLEQSERQRAIEHERSRIARDIHDDLGAHLTRITMLSESARGQINRPEQTIAGLSQIYDTARELTRAMDEIVWAVNPKHDSLEGVVNYLEKFALDLLGAAGIGCQLDFPLQFPKWTLTSEIRHNLFLAFKEALNNLVKHAAATEASLILRVYERHFELIIQDNGRGFVPEAAACGGAEPDRFSSGNGLENLQRRLAKAGGVCLVQSAPGQGTRVLFRVYVG